MSPETKGAYIELAKWEESAKRVIALLEKHGVMWEYLPGETPTERNFIICGEDLTQEIKSQLLEMKADVSYIWDNEGTQDFVEKAGFPLLKNPGPVVPFKKLNLS